MIRRLRVQAHLTRLARSGRPILVGPWRSELGFEGLYWSAFLRWCKVYGGLKASNMVAVTRGGAGVLYPYRAVDLYTLRSVKSVREENAYDRERTGLQKQLTCTPWDRDVLKEAAAHALGRGEKYHVLHPALMYQALAPFWEERQGLQYLHTMTEYSSLPIPNEPVVELPEQFVAVKWYSRATFRLHDPVTQFAAQVTGAIAAQIPVVVLRSGHEGDEHCDILCEGPNIVVMPVVPPDKTVAVQATILKRATAFVGTYGGMAQLALRYGVPSCSFYEAFGATAYAHLSLSHWLGLRSGVPFLCGSIAETTLWRQVLAQPMVAMPPVSHPKPELVAPVAQLEEASA